jgi:hypothetical protein
MNDFGRSGGSGVGSCFGLAGPAIVYLGDFNFTEHQYREVCIVFYHFVILHRFLVYAALFPASSAHLSQKKKKKKARKKRPFLYHQITTFSP